MYGHGKRHTLKAFAVEFTYVEPNRSYIHLNGENVDMVGHSIYSWGHDYDVAGEAVDRRMREQTVTRPDGTTLRHKRFSA